MSTGKFKAVLNIIVRSCLKIRSGVGEMAQQTKTFATKPAKLSLVSGAHVVGRKDS